MAADDPDSPGWVGLLAVRDVSGRAWRRVHRNPLPGRATEPRRHLATVPVARTGHALRRRQPAVHPRNDHPDRHRWLQTPTDDRRRRPNRLSPRHRGLLRLETLGI